MDMSAERPQDILVYSIPEEPDLATLRRRFSVAGTKPDMMSEADHTDKFGRMSLYSPDSPASTPGADSDSDSGFGGSNSESNVLTVPDVGAVEDDEEW